MIINSVSLEPSVEKERCMEYGTKLNTLGGVKTTSKKSSDMPKDTTNAIIFFLMSLINLQELNCPPHIALQRSLFCRQ